MAKRAEKAVLRRFQRCQHCGGIRCGAEIRQQCGSVREQTESCKHVKVQSAVRAVYEEEYVGAFIVWCAEEYRASRTAQGKERL